MIQWRQILSAVAVLMILWAGSLLADESVKHYVVPKPESKVEAIAIIENGIAQIEKTLEAEQLSPAKLEEIHKLTYSLEAAVEVLMKSEGQAASAIALRDSVEELHQHSERREVEKTRSAFQSVKASFERARSQGDAA